MSWIMICLQLLYQNSLEKLINLWFWAFENFKELVVFMQEPALREHVVGPQSTFWTNGVLWGPYHNMCKQLEWVPGPSTQDNAASDGDPQFKASPLYCKQQQQATCCILVLPFFHTNSLSTLRGLLSVLFNSHQLHKNCKPELSHQFFFFFCFSLTLHL